MSGKARNAVFGVSVGVDGLILLLLFQLLLFHSYLACKKLTTYEFIIRRKVAPGQQSKKGFIASASEAYLNKKQEEVQFRPSEAPSMAQNHQVDLLVSNNLQSDTGRPVESSTNMELTKGRADLLFEGDQLASRELHLPRKSDLVTSGRANG
jgi:hypothetical protein